MDIKAIKYANNVHNEDKQSQGYNRRTMCSLTNFSKNKIFFFLNSQNYRMNHNFLDILLKVAKQQKCPKMVKKNEKISFKNTFFQSTFKAKLSFFSSQNYESAVLKQFCLFFFNVFSAKLKDGTLKSY